MIRRSLFLCIISVLLSCESGKEESLFTKIENTGVDFRNDLVYDEQVNTYTFKNFYNGGGVGIGDLDNDGLPEIFFCGSQSRSKLYHNKGNFKFADITEESGIDTRGVWITGVSFVDINADGLLDIYLCKSGPPNGANRNNSLYINQGNLEFIDQATAYGLDNLGLSSHAAFFDFDRDGDLDCYLLNNSIRSTGAYDYVKGLRDIPDSLGGNKLFRNDSLKFKDITEQAGIYRSAIGFGLGVTITDINHDLWPDIYVSNDFFERDYLYKNNTDGTFSEILPSMITELSMGSMGADIADLNNDGNNEIFVTEMLPAKHDRLKTKSQFEKWDKYQLSLENGYHYQFGRNTLQLNNGNETYSEISRLSNMDATDWSWGALIFDMDNDGLKDVFIANGINKDLLDQDYINFGTDPALIRSMINKEEDAIKSLIDMIPSEAIPNYAFKNQGNMIFTNEQNAWGFSEPTFSNGSAYGDLDNDGDLDLIINNINEDALIYKNNAEKEKNHHLRLKLVGTGSNLFAIGSRVDIYTQSQILSQELFPARGFQSSVDYTLVFGLGKVEKIDSLIVSWPNGAYTRINNPSLDTTQIIRMDEANFETLVSITKPMTYFNNSVLRIDYLHEENDYIDFDKERLLFEMNSAKGPCACTGDVNNDGLLDVFIGGSWRTDPFLGLQQPDGTFQKLPLTSFAKGENVTCEFFDYNRDGNLDLIVGNGGSESTSFSLELKDQLYQGDGRGNFTLLRIPFFNNNLLVTGALKTSKWTTDGKQYIFVGGSQIPGVYGVFTNSYLLENNSESISQKQVFENLGLVNDMAWGDIDNDGDEDFVVVGNWMQPKVFLNDQGVFIQDTTHFYNQQGLYNTVALKDINNDNTLDVFLGNKGLNTRYEASLKEPLSMYIGDLDGNGKVEQIIGQYYDGIHYPIVQLKDLLMQVPFLKKKYLRFENYKTATFDEIIADSKTTPIINEVNTLKSTYFLNTDSGFVQQDLPVEAQYSSIHAMHFIDVNGDDYLDMVVGGNDARIKPEWGINAASYGQLFINKQLGGFRYINQSESGLNITGEVKEILEMTLAGKKHLVFIRNNDYPIIKQVSR